MDSNCSIHYFRCVSVGDQQCHNHPGCSDLFQHSIRVDEIQQASGILSPLLGTHAAVIFAVALLFAGVASTVTSGMAAGSIFAGFFGEPYDIKDNHTRLGVVISLALAFLVILFIGNPYKSMIISQMILSIQLPITIAFQVYLTSSKEVMGKYANKKRTIIMLLLSGGVVIFLNIWLFMSFIV